MWLGAKAQQLAIQLQRYKTSGYSDASHFHFIPFNHQICALDVVATRTMSSSPEYRRQESSEEVVMDKEATGAGLQHTMTSGTTVMMSEAMFEKVRLSCIL